MNHDVARTVTRDEVAAVVEPLLPVLATARTITLRVQDDHRRWRIAKRAQLRDVGRAGG